MKWNRGYKSDDVEVRQGSSSSAGGALPLGLISFIFRRFGIGGAVIAVLGFVAFSYFTGSHEDQGAAKTVFGSDGGVYESDEPVWDEGRVQRAR